MKKLSVIVPAFNEEATIERVLEKVGSVRLDDLGFSIEVIVVDDGSSDRTAELARRVAGVKVVGQKNQGKGRAVQAGVEAATGDYVLVQDADLEYDPDDYRRLLPGLDGEHRAVYGSRIMGQRERGVSLPFPGKHPQQGMGPYLANIALSVWCFLLYRRWITDLLTGYKVYPAAAIRNMKVVTLGFETDHEITAKLIRHGLSIVEVPVSYSPRTASEGKKIRMSDGFIAIWTLWRFRWSSS